jgi:hypothetical protein
VEASIFAADQIPTVMLIQKGRQLIFEWLQFLGNNAETRPKILTFLGTLINGMSKFAKKIPEESVCKLFLTKFLFLVWSIYWWLPFCVHANSMPNGFIEFGANGQCGNDSNCRFKGIEGINLKLIGILDSHKIIK